MSTWAGMPTNASSNGSADGIGEDARFHSPRGIALDQSGNLYVADTGNSIIRKITPERKVTTLAGAAGQHGTEDGKGSDARFNHPYGITVDRSGTVFVADTDNHMIRKITADGTVTTVAGVPRIFRSSHGGERISEFFSPRGIVAAPSGELFVTDFTEIHRIGTDGKVTTIGGLKHSRGGQDGVGMAARFSSPSGIALDASANLIIADTGNHTIRSGTPLAR